MQFNVSSLWGENILPNLTNSQEPKPQGAAWEKNTRSHRPKPLFSFSPILLSFKIFVFLAEQTLFNELAVPRWGAVFRL